MNAPASVVVVPVRQSVEIVRARRGNCVLCGLRRVLYRVKVSSLGDADTTEARCAPCWGIR